MLERGAPTMQTHFFSESLTRRALDQQELAQRRHAGHHGQLGMVADGGAARTSGQSPMVLILQTQGAYLTSPG